MIGLFLILPNRGSAHASEATEDHVQIAMKNVMYHYTGPIAVHVVQLQGEILPTKSGDIPVFDDKNSFILALNSAEIAISCDALAHQRPLGSLQTMVPAGPSAPDILLDACLCFHPQAFRSRVRASRR